MVFVIKDFVINLKFNLYIRLLSVKVYIAVFIRELIKIVYFGLVFCVYNLLKYLIVLCFFASLLS
jgi:hypothetical protein